MFILIRSFRWFTRSRYNKQNLPW